MDKKVGSFFEKAKVSAEMLANATSTLAVQAADNVTQKSASAMQSAKTKVQVFDLNTEIEILYKEIGKLVYDVHCGLDGDQEQLQIKLALIDEKNAKIAELQAANTAKAVPVCPVCGTAYQIGDSFCSNCGSQL